MLPQANHQQVVDSPNRCGIYLYCITMAGPNQEFGPIGIGGRGDPLYTIAADRLQAVVSDSPQERYPLWREFLLAHEKGIEEVMKSRTVLPVRFGTVAESPERVRIILQRERQALLDLLQWLEGKKSLSLKAVFHEKYIFQEMIAQRPEIQRIRRQAGSRADLMEVGERVAAALEEEKERHRREVLDLLEPLAEEIRLNDNIGDRMFLNAAFLTTLPKEAEFDRVVNALSDRYAGQVRFLYIGTLPPFDFVNLVIET
jgi:hypothetical protein